MHNNSTEINAAGRRAVALAGLAFAMGLAVSTVAPSASAATLVYMPETTNTVPETTDLSRVTASTADDLTLVSGPGAPTPPDGIAVGDNFTVPRFFGGDGSGLFGSPVNTNFLFDLNLGAGQTVRVSSSISVDVFPQNLKPVGMSDVTLSLYVDGDADGVGGTAGDTLLGTVTPPGGANPSSSYSGSFVADGLMADVRYLLQVTGNLLDFVEIGSYRLNVAALPPDMQVIPLPPALLLFITAVGALFGLGRARRIAARL